MLTLVFRKEYVKFVYECLLYFLVLLYRYFKSANDWLTCTSINVGKSTLAEMKYPAGKLWKKRCFVKIEHFIIFVGIHDFSESLRFSLDFIICKCKIMKNKINGNETKSRN